MSLSADIGFDDFYLAGGSKPDLFGALDLKTVYRSIGITAPEKALLAGSTAFYRVQEEEGATGTANNLVSTFAPASYAGAVITAKKALYHELILAGVIPLTTTWGTVVHQGPFEPGYPLYTVTNTLADDSLWLEQSTDGEGIVAPQIYFVFHDYATELIQSKAAWLAEWDTAFATYVAAGLATGNRVCPYISPLYEQAPWGDYLPTEVWRHILEVVLASVLAGDVEAPIILAGYEFPATHSGTAQSGSTSTTINLAVSASASDDAYNGYQVRITSGTGAGQGQFILDYVGSTRVATVPAWTTTPDATSVYAVGAATQVAWNASADAWLAVTLEVFAEGSGGYAAAAMRRRRKRRVLA